VSLEAGRRAVALHHLDPARDRFLADHTLGRGISDDDPSLTALAVVPLTMTMELVAEAAALVVPGQVLTGLREFRAHRWITAESPRVLELTADAVGGHAVKVVLRERGAAGAAAPALAESIVEFAAAAPEAPAAGGFRLAGEDASRWPADALYRDGMFHGPAFRAVRSMDRAGDDGATATLSVLPASGLLDGRPAPGFLTDPVLLDAAGQVLAFWVKERLGVEVDVFPYRVGAVRVFGPPPAPGGRITCRVRGEIDGAMRTRCDIDLVDEAGRVRYRLESWEDRQFRLPAGLLALRTAPRDAFVGDAWRPVLAGAPDTDLQGARISGFDTAALESHHGIWLKMLAGLVLSRRERASWDALAAATPKRRVEWLLGRVAAKEAVRRLVERRTGARLLSADIEILPDGVGRPQVSGAWQARLSVEPAVSLSHSDGVVVAIAAGDRRTLVGVDVEHLSIDADAVAAAAFTPEEREWLATLDDARRREWVVRLWSAKEAAGKALGRGFTDGLSALTLARAETETGAVRLEARRDQAGGPAGRRRAELVTHTAREGDHVSSITLLPAEEPKE
jgi:phosphopantetheine--protein transferase-like protein